MKAVITRVNSANVKVENKTTSKIEKGLLVLVGFTQEDNIKNIEHIAKKIVNLRIFDDENGVMNKSVLDIKGNILSVSQFTLYGDASKGNRPNYMKALKSEDAKKLYELFNKELEKYIKVKTGIFQAEMQVESINDGPVTIIIEK